MKSQYNMKGIRKTLEYNAYFMYVQCTYLTEDYNFLKSAI